MTSESGKIRRRYGTQFKAMVLARCEEPGASVAQVAMAHGINDNVVHRWRQLARQRQAAPLVAAAERPAPAEFVPLALPAPAAAEVKTEVCLEVRRAAVTVSVARARAGRPGRLRARAAEVIRVDAVWLAVQPLDMRLGTEAALARVVGVFGAAHPSHDECSPARRLPSLVAGAAATGADRLGHDEGHRLQPHALEGTHPR